MSDGRVKCDTDELWRFYSDTRQCQEFLDEHFQDLYAKLNALEQRLSEEAQRTEQEIACLEAKVSQLSQNASQGAEDVSAQLAALRAQIAQLQDHRVQILQYQKAIPEQKNVLDKCKREYQSHFQECRKIVNRYLQMLEMETAKGEMQDAGDAVGNGQYHSVNYRGITFYVSDTLFDVKAKNEQGKTNLQLMQEGNAPIGHDGKPVELHHMQQSERIGGIMEVSSTMHKTNHKALHMNTHDIPSGISRANFAVLKKAYWKRRAEQITNGGMAGTE